VAHLLFCLLFKVSHALKRALIDENESHRSLPPYRLWLKFVVEAALTAKILKKGGISRSWREHVPKAQNAQNRRRRHHVHKRQPVKVAFNRLNALNAVCASVMAFKRF